MIATMKPREFALKVAANKVATALGGRSGSTAWGDAVREMKRKVRGYLDQVKAFHKAKARSRKGEAGDDAPPQGLMLGSGGLYVTAVEADETDPEILVMVDRCGGAEPHAVWGTAI